MSGASIMKFDSVSPIPDLSALEFAVAICCARRPGIDAAGVAAEIGRWFNVSIVDSDLSAALRRLVHREWVSLDAGALCAVGMSCEKAELAARGIIHLMFRDRYFFDVGKLLDVAIVREDHTHED